jgi:arylsulfatase A-like enzyme
MNQVHSTNMETDKLSYRVILLLSLVLAVFGSVFDFIDVYSSEFILASIRCALKSFITIGLLSLLSGLLLWIVLNLIGRLTGRWLSLKMHAGLLLGVCFFLVLFGYLFASSDHKTVALIKAEIAGVVIILAAVFGLALLDKFLPIARGLSKVGPIVYLGIFIPVVIITVVIGRSQINDMSWDRINQQISKRPSAGEGLPDIFILMMDTARFDRFSFNGYSRKTSPNLDQFAEDATVFENAFSTSSWTLPAHASLFTGLYPSQHRAHGEHMYLNDSYRTLAEILVDKGYQTVCFSNNGNVSRNKNMVQGFDIVSMSGKWEESRPREGALVKGWIHTIKWLSGKFPLPFAKQIVGALQNTGGSDAVTTNRMMLEWLDEHRVSGRPFLIFVNYMENHSPYIAPRDMQLKWLSEEDLVIAAKKKLATPTLDMDQDFAKSGLGAEDFRIMNGLYDSTVFKLDSDIGQLFQDLAERNLYEDSLIIVTSDHGEYLGEHNRILHGFDLHDAVFRIPLVIRKPKIFKAGATDATLVNLIDIFETVLSIAGVDERPEGMPDAMALFNTKERAEVYGEVKFNAPILRGLALRDDKSKYFDEHKTVRDLTYHYIWHYRRQSELYKIDEDFAENENLHQSHPDLRAEYQQKLFGWFLSLPEYEATGEKHSLTQEEIADDLRQLQDLGYIR